MNTHRISLNDLTPDLKDKLLSGKVLIPTALAALGAFTFIAARDVDHVDDKVSTPPNTLSDAETVSFEAKGLISTADNNLSFGDAFRSQRDALGPGGIFEYKNKYYNTFLKDEWDAMSDEQKNEYFTSIHKYIDNQSIVHHDIHGNSTSVKIEVSIDPNSGEVTVESLTPNVNIESVTVNTGGTTPVDPTPVDPTPVDPTPVDPTPVDPTPVDPTPVDPIPEPPGDDNIVDPSVITVEDKPELPVIDHAQDDNLLDPSIQNVTETMINDEVIPGDEITIDPADFNF